MSSRGKAAAIISRVEIDSPLAPISNCAALSTVSATPPAIGQSARISSLRLAAPDAC
jgi:hypothetical protein